MKDLHKISIILNQTTNGQDTKIDVLPVYDLDSGDIVSYSFEYNDNHQHIFTYDNISGKPLSKAELQQILFDYLSKNTKTIYTAKVTWLDPPRLKQAIQETTDMFLYDAEIPRSTDDNDRFKTDINYDQYDLTGGSYSKTKPDNSTTMERSKARDTKEYDKTGWTWSMQPTSEPENTYWDSPDSTAKEEERQGIYPSYGMIMPTNKPYKSKAWTNLSTSLFSRFIDVVYPTLTRFKRAGFDSITANNLLYSLYFPIFNKFDNLDNLVNRFINKVYGTVRPKCEAKSIEASINSYVSELINNNFNTFEIYDKIHDEYSDWLDASDLTREYVISRINLERIKTIKSSTNLLNKKLKFLTADGVEGIVTKVSNTPYYFKVDINLLNPYSNSIYANTEDTIIIDSTNRYKQASIKNKANVRILKTAMFAINSLIAANDTFPLTYSNILNWCRKANIESNLSEMASLALELGLLKLSENTVYVSDDKATVQSLNIDDPTKAPEKITTKDGKELHKQE